MGAVRPVEEVAPEPQYVPAPLVHTPDDNKQSTMRLLWAKPRRERVVSFRHTGTHKRDSEILRLGVRVRGRIRLKQRKKRGLKHWHDGFKLPVHTEVVNPADEPYLPAGHGRHTPWIPYVPAGH